MAEPITLSVDTGTVSIDVVNERGEKIGEFEFNPIDSNILSRFDNVVGFFNNVKFVEEVSATEKEDEIKKLSKAIEEQFDYLLGYKVSKGIFGRCGALTVTASGDFFFENVIDGLGKIIENLTQKRINKKIEKIRMATIKYSK